MHRVNIVYVGNNDTSFDWHHYLNKHLPIACGVSSRYAPIIRCDVDRPVNLGAETGDQNSGGLEEVIVAICTVHFASLATQNDFRHFFASGHQDSAQILADEPNYTTIQPSFNAGQFKISNNTAGQTGYRVKFLFPREKKPINIDTLDAAVSSLTTQLKELGLGFTGNEIDQCQFDVPPDAPSAYEFMVAINVEDKQGLIEISRHLNTAPAKNRYFKEYLGVSPLVIFSEVVNFDLALCAP